MGDNCDLSINDLTTKKITLQAITRPSRSADLANLSLKLCKYRPEGITLSPTALAKTPRQNKPITEFFYPRFQETKRLCPVEATYSYVEKTSSKRTSNQSTLFIALITPHNAVTPPTISRWI